MTVDTGPVGVSIQHVVCPASMELKRGLENVLEELLVLEVNKKY